ncbi:glycoside hydrolase family 3 N-terminal domain-containing protein [uncultured Polaribacter sp.]|uniref:glycoside hydrolase family 3 protein n=1 Tax=uncultured Polaribacter sp. TaxID=174711 RepID=UPI00260362D1|nr:glycoside hydrolase family 3 N-terminal domain-containing protein [uncultured Polaribacter sp.]
MKKNISIILILVLVILSCDKKENPKKFSKNTNQTKWVDSIYNKMTLKEKVGQLFMVAAYSNKEKSHADSIQQLIKDTSVGGLIFFQGAPVKQAELTNLFQTTSKVPLLIGMDAEWGLNMRLDSTTRYPYNMTLGAVENSNLIKRIGEQIGRDCKRLGVHINFAPVVDINTNSKNPVIGVRSFAEDKMNVTNKALAFTEGLQSQGVLACAKHFPGHGDTDKDSHKILPTVSLSKERIDTVELYPYKKLFQKKIAGVMVAHLNVPSLESKEGLPSSLSYQIVSNILKNTLEFKGLIFTDALRMKGVSNYKESGALDLAAFKAGNDVLLMVEDVSKGISKIMEAYTKKEITEERLAHSVKKILAAKFNVHLNQYKPVVTSKLVSDLNDKNTIALNEEVFTNAVTIIKNKNQMLPVKKDQQVKTAFIKLGDGSSDTFLKELKSHIDIDELSGFTQKELLRKLKAYGKVIIGYHRSNVRKTSKISTEDKVMIENLAKENRVILDVFASQYCLEEVSFKNIEASVISYENTEIAQRISAQIILGIQKAKGRLPASINEEFMAGYGIKHENN